MEIMPGNFKGRDRCKLDVAEKKEMSSNEARTNQHSGGKATTKMPLTGTNTWRKLLIGEEGNCCSCIS